MAAMVEVKNLKKYFPTARGTLHAVDNVSMNIEPGKTMGVVGESGCGKSTLGRTIIHLLESTGGWIFFEGKDISVQNEHQLKELRRAMQLIFQDPYSSLNPRMTIKDAIQEPLVIARKLKRGELYDETENLMQLVGIDHRMMRAYPHELDGGRRQRVSIARALAMQPKFIVCDEPVSALDVSIQAQIINLLLDLQDRQRLTYMFITHDMSVVRYLSDDICVMYLGQVVEISPAKEMFTKTLHPYTKVLLSAVPTIDLDDHREFIMAKGEITSPIEPKPGCRFAARCMYVKDQCHAPQILKEILPNHFVSCCRVEEIN
jgi:peptide/nickel transport system ATP-binding protein